MVDVLSILASLLACASMGLYLRQLLRGSSVPNPVTWIIWLVIGVINGATYFLVVHGSWLRSLSLVIVTSGIAAVTVYSLVRGKFARLAPLDWACLSLSVLVGLLWRATGDPGISNLLLQSVYVISFIPTVVDLRAGRIREEPLPWILAVGAYTLMIVSVLLTWGEGSWIALAHPVLNGLLGNGSVALCALYPPRPAHSRALRAPRPRLRSGRRRPRLPSRTAELRLKYRA